MKKRFCFLIALMLLLFCCLPPQTAFGAATPAAGKVTTAGSNLNVREKATTSSSIITKLANKAWITLIEKQGDWWRVRCGDQTYGYCHSAYITPRQKSSHAVLQASSGSVIVYREEKTSSAKKATLTNGSAVAVLTKGENWSCILYQGTRKGYVQTAYLRACSTAPIALNVPRYAQTDARWRNVPIGTTGGTIGSIGCTTSCLAMCETYLSGQNVTPAEMAKRLKYTAGGSLYWPESYTVRLADGNALQQIYAQLKKGSPVIFGAKKANGTQHWVVITSCDGSGLSPSAFSINDPGTASRKTLAQLLTVYPMYYKLAWR